MKLELNKVYKDRTGKQWKVVCKSSDDWFIVVNKEQDNSYFATKAGKFSLCGEDSSDLIELVGDDFIEDKKPREFKFEAHLLEYEGGYPSSTCAIEKALGRVCGRLRTAPLEYIRVTNAIESEWEVTMREKLK